MDREGTTDTAIKIKWTAVTSATEYTIYFDNVEIEASLNTDVTEFVFNSTSLANFEVKKTVKSTC